MVEHIQLLRLVSCMPVKTVYYSLCFYISTMCLRWLCDFDDCPYRHIVSYHG